MKAYRFITGDDNSEFCHRVSEALSNDWELYGKSQIFFDPILYLFIKNLLSFKREIICLFENFL